MSFDEDAELLARLRAADPAAALPDATPDRVAGLLEDTMTADLDHTSSDTGRRSALPWLAAAAAVVIIAGLGFALLGGDDSSPTTPSTPPVAAPSVTELEAPGATEGRCAVPSAALLVQADTALAGTVTAVEGDQVTLSVDQWYLGGATDEVVVTAPPEALSDLVGAVEFEPGAHYLLAATGGQLMACGFSGVVDDARTTLYDQAFGG